MTNNFTTTTTKSFLKALVILIIASSFYANAACNANMTREKPDSIYGFSDDLEVVIDGQTGLMWQRCQLGKTGPSCIGDNTKKYWAGALQTAEDANASNMFGYNDWRLPSIAELSSLADRSCNDPTINPTVFPNTYSYYFWSSTPHRTTDDRAWYVYFKYGHESTHYKAYINAAVRLVRDAK